MKKLRWQLIIIFLTGLVVGILLLGEQPVVLPSGPEPAQGGQYAEGLIGSLTRLNPILDYYNPADRNIDRLIFSGLIKFDERGVALSDLAESWGISKDGTVYNFALRQNLKWHDGEPLTSDDVVYTIDLLREGASVIPADLSEFWKDVDVKVLNETTLQFRLPEPFAPFLDFLAFGVLPRHVFGDLGVQDIISSQYNLKPVGSGPFKFDHLIIENSQIAGIVLSASKEYYGKQPYIEQVVFRYYPDAASAYQAYQDGLVQGISEVNADILKPVLADINLGVYTSRKPELNLVLLNLNNPQVPYFQVKEIRKALLLGLNRQWMIDHLLNGQAFVANGPILPGSWAYYDQLPSVDYDPTQARQLLKDAGYVIVGDQTPVRKKDNSVLNFTLIYPDNETFRRLAEELQKNWADLNIQVTIEPVPYAELINNRLDQRLYQAALVDLNMSGSPDPDPYPFWDQSQATGGQNYSQWDNRSASEYLEQARITPDITERARLYRNFQVVFDNELPSLPLFFPTYTYAVDRQLQGVSMGPLFDSSDRFVTILNWFLVVSRPLQETVNPTTTQ